MQGKIAQILERIRRIPPQNVGDVRGIPEGIDLIEIKFHPRLSMEMSFNDCTYKAKLRLEVDVCGALRPMEVECLTNEFFEVAERVKKAFDIPRTKILDHPDYGEKVKSIYFTHDEGETAEMMVISCENEYNKYEFIYSHRTRIIPTGGELKVGVGNEVINVCKDEPLELDDGKKFSIASDKVVTVMIVHR